MRTLFTGIATIIALGTALPAFASDVTSDRYAPGPAARERPAATRTVAVAAAAAAAADPQAPRSKRMHCTCERASPDERPSVDRQEPGGH